jgi:hypothetical protein
MNHAVEHTGRADAVNAGDAPAVVASTPETRLPWSRRRRRRVCRGRVNAGDATGVVASTPVARPAAFASMPTIRPAAVALTPVTRPKVAGDG